MYARFVVTVLVLAVRCVSVVKMSEPSPSIKYKMLCDAGYDFPEPWKNYVLLVDFLKAIVNRKIYSLGVSMENAKHAEDLLKHIGELDG